ncbi:hypothetical protein [Thermotoga sp.]|uniref:hypothetical protein n=1 Tax=Thermotoga sp. TaxID=28240 RepID=UPI0025E9B737|nr:hypothetical protein [Thermotoga sp.]
MKDEHKVKICVINSKALSSIQKEIEKYPSKLEEHWWIPKTNTNPRGFGLKKKTVKKLVEESKNSGNYLEIDYKPFTEEEKARAKKEYFENWYELIKAIAKKYHYRR